MWWFNLQFLKKVLALIPFDIRDIFVFGGLSSMFYGIRQFNPWMAFAICGLLLMLIGLFFGRRGP
jgi:hypothetical protein